MQIYNQIADIQSSDNYNLYCKKQISYEFTPIKVFNDRVLECCLEEHELEINPRFAKDDEVSLAGSLHNNAIGIVNKTKNFTEIYELPAGCDSPKDLLKG